LFDDPIAAQGLHEERHMIKWRGEVGVCVCVCVQWWWSFGGGFHVGGCLSVCGGGPGGGGEGGSRVCGMRWTCMSVTA
jgi:hypothetical protein